MELIDAIALIASQVNSSGQPAELYIGTVDSLSPLSVKLDESQASIREEILFRTDSVIERKIPALKHRHSYTGGNTGSSFQATIDGKLEPLDNDYIVLNKGLAVGDKVLLLSVQQGQKFIILSHLY